jgi:hypothetical protein
MIPNASKKPVDGPLGFSFRDGFVVAFTDAEEMRMGSPQYARLILEGEAISGAGAIESRSLLGRMTGSDLPHRSSCRGRTTRGREWSYSTPSAGTRVARFTCGRVLRAPFGSSPTRWRTSVGITVTATKSYD